MGSKRAAIASDGDMTYHVAKRTKKSCHLPEHLQIEYFARKDSSLDTSSDDSRLHLLRHVVQDILSGPEITRVQPEVMKAITMLDSVLRHTESSLPRQHFSKAEIETNLKDDPHEWSIPPPILDSQLEQAVFTHPAYGKGHDGAYDRLEILGDAYIELIATKLIWEKFPGISSGRISQIRELLVKNESLAELAERFGFDHKALVPATHSEQQKRWIKTKGDIFEAYVAAVILSRPVGGYQVAEQWLHSVWRPKLDSLGRQKSDLRSKEELAKKIMARGIKLEYLEERPSIQRKGSGTQTFFIGVYLTGWGWVKKHLGSGSGASKAVAGDEAAMNALLNTSLISEIAKAKTATSR